MGRSDNSIAAATDDVSVTVSSDLPDWLDLQPIDDAGIYADLRWGAIMQQVYGARPHYLTATRGPRVVGGLMLIEQRSLLFGSHCCSVPYFDAAGIVGEDHSATGSLIASAGKLRKALRVSHIEIRQLTPLEGIPARTDKVTMWLDLPEEPDALWRGLKAKVRNQVRKPQKANMIGEQGGVEFLEAFYQVYSRNMRDLGSPPHSKRFFQAIFDTFTDSARVHVIRTARHAAPVAASLTLTDPNAVHVPWAGSDWRHRQDCPNMLLYWQMLEDSCRKGARRFDFGRSTRGAGTYRFKAQWGAEEIALYWHYLTPDGKIPAMKPDSSKYRFFVSCWKKMPLFLSRLIGPRIIGKLS